MFLSLNIIVCPSVFTSVGHVSLYVHVSTCVFACICLHSSLTRPVFSGARTPAAGPAHQPSNVPAADLVNQWVVVWLPN